MLDADAAFLQTIIQTPEDDAPRLIYADYLDERGESDRAEFIRVQCKLARTLPNDPARSMLQSREQELLSEHRVEWKQHLPTYDGIHWQSFERGFVSSLRVDDPAILIQFADSLFRATPIEQLAMHRLDPTNTQRFADLPHLGSIRVLDLDDGNRIGNQGLSALSGSPFLGKLELMRLRSNGIGSSGVRDLVYSKTIHKLTYLDLDHNQLLDLGARYLSESANLQNLRALSLGWSSIGDEGLIELSKGKYFSKLRWLYLTGNNLTDAGVTSFAASPYFEELRELHLANNLIGDQGAVAIAQSATLQKLTWLYMKRNHIHDVGARALAESPYLESISELVLGENDFSAEIGDELKKRFGRRVWLW